MDKKLFSYEDCINKLNSVVQRKQTQLPSVQGKTNKLREINDFMHDYNLPVLYRYMSLSINTILGIVNEDVYMVPARNLNDAFEGAPFGIISSNITDTEEIQRIQNDVYVKAFSYKKNDNLMWSHYGDSHKGICIGYDFSIASKDVIKHLYPVQYSDTRFSHTQTTNIVSHPFLYLRKSNCWAYEEEFRLLYTKDELSQGTQNILLGCITEIQFGLRVSPEQMRLIADIVSTKNKIVRLYKTKLKEDSFTLERENYVTTNIR